MTWTHRNVPGEYPSWYLNKYDLEDGRVVYDFSILPGVGKTFKLFVCGYRHGTYDTLEEAKDVAEKMKK